MPQDLQEVQTVQLDLVVPRLQLIPVNRSHQMILVVLQGLTDLAVLGVLKVHSVRSDQADPGDQNRQLVQMVLEDPVDPEDQKILYHRLVHLVRWDQ